jgi:hypothetical protein
MSRRTRRSRRRPLLVLVTLLLAVGAFLLWTRSGDPAPAAVGTPTPTTSAAAPSASDGSSGAVSQDPSDAEPEEDGEEATSRPTATPAAPEPEDEDEADAGGLTAVTVSLSYTGFDTAAAAVVAGGYADGVVEEDATCTLVLRRGGVELRGESLGTPNVTTTDCGEVRVGGDALTPGTWEAVLSYTSDRSAGESAVGEVVVP